MHVRLLIAALLLCSKLALAQAEGETPPEPPPQQPPADQVPAEKLAPRLPTVKIDLERDKSLVEALAKQFFTAIILGEARPIMEMSALPFNLEDKKLNSEEEFLQAWQKALRQNTGMLTLYGVEVLSAADLEKKYGKPPARLANFPWKKQPSLIAVGNISGRAAIVVFLKSAEESFVAIGYHD